MHIFAVNVSGNLNNDLYENLLMQIEDSKRDRINKLTRIEDTRRVLLSDILSRVVACNILGISNNNLSFSVNSHGKPYLKDFPDYCYNISHSGEWVTCVADNYQVGIDIEKIKPINYDLAKRFFTEEEYRDLMRKADDEKLNYFYDLWTLKESYIKAVGKGLNIPLNSFYFTVNKEQIRVNGPKRSSVFSFRQYHLSNTYKLAVCSTNKECKFPKGINTISYLDMIKEFSSYC